MKLNNEEMYIALLNKDTHYEGLFVAAIKTTGIFCRPSCTARKPKPENVEYFETSREALLQGYRPCKVCHPLEALGATPDYIEELLQLIEQNPATKITDYDLVKRHIEPNKVRRWFKKNHGISFQAYQRMIRINGAFSQMKNGETILNSALDAGFNSVSGFTHAYKNIIGDSPSANHSTNVITITRFSTPLGPMIAGSTDKGICLIEFSDRRMLETELNDLKRIYKAELVYGENEYLQEAQTQLAAYFDGKRKVFDLILDTPGSVFQNKVWAQLRTIPYGKTRSYKEQAIAIDNPQAIRAVGKANGMNRIAIVIPCHRVIGASGQLVGYGGGVWRKQFLLELERNNS